MKVKVKEVFFDNSGVHSVGEIIETETFDERRMELVKTVEKEQKRAKKVEK